MSRHSQLSPLSVDEQAALCIMLCNFFSPMEYNNIAIELGLPQNVGAVKPLSNPMEFFAPPEGDRRSQLGSNETGGCAASAIC